MSIPVFMEAADGGADSVQLQLDTSSSAKEKVLSNKEDIYSFIHLFCCTFLTFFVNTSQWKD